MTIYRKCATPTGRSRRSVPSADGVARFRTPCTGRAAMPAAVGRTRAAAAFPRMAVHLPVAVDPAMVANPSVR